MVRSREALHGCGEQVALAGDDHHLLLDEQGSEDLHELADCEDVQHEVGAPLAVHVLEAACARDVQLQVAAEGLELQVQRHALHLGIDQRLQLALDFLQERLDAGRDVGGHEDYLVEEVVDEPEVDFGAHLEVHAGFPQLDLAWGSGVEARRGTY